MINPTQSTDINLTQCSAAVFLTDGGFLTTTDGLVALARELIEPVGASAQYKVVKTSYAGLSLLGHEVTRLVEAALQPDAPANLVESARQGIEGFLTLLEDREEDDISEVYAAITLLRLASAQFEAITLDRDHFAFSAPSDEAEAFRSGVDLAVEMMREGETHWGTDRAELSLENRDGLPQVSIALPYLKRAMAEPALLSGFGAVLSTLVGVGDKLDAAYIQKHAAGAYASPISQRSAAIASLSTQAIADIDAHIVRTTGVIELFLERGGEPGADIVNILDFTKLGLEKAKAVKAFDDVWHRLIETESLLKGAMVLAETGQGTCRGAVALLGDLIDQAEALSSKFDGGEHDIARKHASPLPVAGTVQKVAEAA